MKGGARRFWRASLATALALVLALAGCGSSSGKSAAPSELAVRGASSSQAAGFEGGFVKSEEFAPDMAAEAPSAPVVPEDRKVVRHSNLTLETVEFDGSLGAINRLIAEVGGYIQRQDMDGQSMYYTGDYYERSAKIYARIPADRLDEVTGKLGELCNVVSQSESMDDITDNYMDVETRLGTLKIQEERLLAILEKAERLEDVITLESALSQVRYEIESFTSSLNRMDSQVSHSFLNITLREVVEYNVQKAQPKNFGERLMNSFERSVRNLTDTLEYLLFFVIEEGPILIVYAVFIMAVVYLVRKLRRTWRWKAHTQAPQRPEEPEQK